MKYHNLFICADPGARSSTVAAWLQDRLNKVAFDVGLEIGTFFQKAHTDFGNTNVLKFNGIKIRIRPTYNKLAIHQYLFLIKNVYTQIPEFSNNQFDLETLTKVTRASNYWFAHDQQINNSLYDFVVSFEDTYDIDIMTELYTKINKSTPSFNQISMLKQINELNDPILDKNHSCVVASMILKREKELGLKESNRQWSIVNVYQNFNQTNIYDTIYSSIRPSKYSIG